MAKTFDEWHNETYNKKKKKKTASDDIAPVRTTTILTGDDIAPPVTIKKDDGKRNFFQKSEYFADGKWDKGDLTKTILGSVTDLGEKLGTGAIGSGEKLLDFGMVLGTAMNEQNLNQAAQNEMIFNAVTGKETEGVLDNYNAFQQQAEKETAEFVAKDLYDESAIAKKIISAPIKEKTGVDSETASVFAERSDELAIATGEQVTTKLIGTILGGPAGLLATGFTSGGSEVEEALKQGATFDEAVTSGIITASSSMGAGAFFNGVKFGGETLTEGAIQKVASAVSSKTLQTLTKWGINTVGEGVEEVIEDAMSSVGQKLTYLDEKEFNEIFNSETAWESFLGGIILGGMFEGVDIGVNKIKGTDYVSGSTKSEQNTFNKLVEERVSEATKEQAIEKAVNKAIEEREKAQGGKFTDENKKALRETVMAQIESGEIDISSEKLNKKDVAKIEKEIKGSLNDGKIDLSKIEEILTPDATKEINELKETLNNTKDEQKKAEIEGKIKQLESVRAENLKSQARENKYLRKAVYEKIASDTKYEDDSEITDDYEKAVVESAKRNANNTTETRKYVDVVRKLAKDRQTRYVFTNNKELLEQGDLVVRDYITPEEQAKIKSLESQLSKATTKETKADIQARLLALKYLDTGGMVRKNDNGVETVLINVDSIQSNYSVVGHETKHTLEKYRLNEKFNEVLFEYAKSKGDLDTVRNRIADIYKNQENVDIDGEVAAELTGKYLFEDEKFLETLMKNKSDSKVRQAIEKIKELIDDLVIRFKGTKQEKQLREVQKKFTELYNSTDADIVGESTQNSDIEKSVYSLNDNLENIGKILYDNNNPLAVVNRAKSNNNSSINWVYKSEIFSVTENKQFHEKISEINQGSQAFEKNSRDEYMLPIGNKIIFTDGNYESPYIREIVEVLTEYSTDFEDIKECIYSVEKGESEQSEAARYVQNTFGEGRIVSYTSRNNGVYEWENGKRKGKTRRTVVRNYLNKRYRTRNDKQGQETQIKEIAPIKETSSRAGVFSNGKKPNENPTDNPNIHRSLAKQGENVDYNKSLRSMRYNDDLPIRDDIWEKANTDLGDIPIRDDIWKKANTDLGDLPIREDIATTKTVAEEDIAPPLKSLNSEEYISFEDFINRESSVWNNVDYNDEATKTKIVKETHKSMVAESKVVIISDEVKNNVAQAYPDLHSMKKKDRTPILKEAMNKLKINLRTFLNGFKNQSFEFEVSGKVLEAKLYNTGINEVLEKITQDKAEMLYSTKEIFHNARYLYSTPDYDGDPSVYRWNYFYTPVQIGEQIVGVRIAVRDMATPKESQIYNWGIKKDTSLDGVGRGTKDRISNDVSSDVSTGIIPDVEQNVNGKKNQDEKQRSWVKTSTESEAVDGKVLIEDLDQEAITYQPITNKDTLNKANERLSREGYNASVEYFNNQFKNKNVSIEDIALGERLIQEAIKKGDTKTASELIQNVAILGTELGQKVQALSIIQRLTPEGQLKMLTKLVERGKNKGDKVYEGVKITQKSKDAILGAYNNDGSYDQKKLDEAVEQAKQEIADQMKVTAIEKVNAWRMLAMLGNPKTHGRNIISNVAMRGTISAKNVVARTIEDISDIKGIKSRTKTWKRKSADVKAFAKKTTLEMRDVISGDSKYSDANDIKSKRQMFKNKILNGVYEFNSDGLEKEDWWFSKPAFENSFAEFLTANGIKTNADIKKNPAIVEKAKAYALEQSQIATFRQYSYLANKIGEIERKNAATQVIVGAIVPFKKTPINIAKTGLNYSPLGFAKTLTYDAMQVKKGNMEASVLIDHLAQNLTGTGLALAGYMLAQIGFLNGGGEDDEEAEYDYQLGEQKYSLNIGGDTYSLSWLTPVAMPLFVGANAYEQLVEGKEWNGDVVIEALTKTLDPLNEMSVLSGLTDILSSYESGAGIISSIIESMGQSYVSQFIPTLLSQIATVTDDTKRSTKVSGDSDFKFVDETINKLMYKIPGLRQMLEPSTDIWGNEVKQSENVGFRVLETFLSPASRKEDITSFIDNELKEIYNETGDNGLFPNIPKNSVQFEGESYKMSAEDYTEYKKTYGQTAYDLMNDLFASSVYKTAPTEEKADMINEVYDYARDNAHKNYLAKYGIAYTNATKDGVKYYKENSIVGAVRNDVSTDEYEFSIDSPEKYMLSKVVTNDVAKYKQYKSDLNDIRADKDANGKKINGSAKEKKVAYINSLDIEYGAKCILLKSEYSSDDSYNTDIIEYLNSRSDITYEEKKTILEELGATIDSNGDVYW